MQIIDVSDPTDIVAKDTAIDTARAQIQLAGAMGVDTFTLTGTYAGTYAIVTAFYDDGVQVIDISDPTNITTTDSGHDDSDNPAYTEFNGANDVDVFTIGASTYAIVASVADNGVQVIDVSNPNNIVASGELDDCTDDSLRPGGCTAHFLGGANAVDTFTLTGTYAGTYAIVTAETEDAVQIIDVSDPTNNGTIIPKDSATDSDNGFTALNGANAVDTFTIGASTYAIVTAAAENSVQIIDVSDPTDIVAVDAATDGINGFNIMNAPGDVDVFAIGTSTYAIVTSIADDGVQIIDVSDPTDIVAVDSLVDSGSLELATAYGVDTFTIHGNTYAIVTGRDDDGIQMIQLSTDEEFVKITKLVELDESVSLADATDVGKAYTKSLSESISLADSASNRANISLSETISFTDDTSVGKTVTQSLTESIFLADIAFENKDTVIPITEFVSLADSMSRSRVSFISLGESISLTDSASETKDTVIPITESVSFTDDTSVGKTVTQYISESIFLADIAFENKDTVIPITEFVSFTDSTASGKAMKISVSESISLTDSLVNRANISLSESVSFTDDTSVGKTVTQYISESIFLADIAFENKDTVIPITEFVSFTDSTASGKAMKISVSESISLTDSLVNRANISLSESVSFTDDTSVGKTVTQYISESVSLSDIANKELEKSLTESISLAD